ncbi:MAG: [citrate (pro-3S)-lyase] ligase, partial [Treponema sp.]|nr:[citrate (pro-3S)-lyase] ligase [Treponema sp.]
MELQTGFPFRGEAQEELRGFLEQNGLKYDERIEYSLILREENRIAASGSLDGRVLKCIAVSPDFQGSGAAAQIVTELISEAARRGHYHLFLFTKPENEDLFGSLGFFTISKTGAALLMENKKEGIQNFVSSIQRNAPPLAANNRDRGAVVVNCNPFSWGHRYLIASAAQQCALLYVFVVAENKSAFPAEIRRNLVIAGTADLPNVRVHSTGPYLVSSATFPDYFLKDTVSPEQVNTELDIAVFAEHFAKPLGINVRFVGTEPFDPVTLKYNRQMAEILPRYNIGLVEIPRLEIG